MTGKTKICPLCQNEFVTGQNAQVYCSARCRRGMYAKQRREKQSSRKFTCAYCGVIFEADKKRKYCCEDCRLKMNGRRLAKPKARKKASLSLEQVAKLSREAGMSYGEYVQKMRL
jgi:hypothetical protein